MRRCSRAASSVTQRQLDSRSATRLPRLQLFLGLALSPSVPKIRSPGGKEKERIRGVRSLSAHIEILRGRNQPQLVVKHAKNQRDKKEGEERNEESVEFGKRR